MEATSTFPEVGNDFKFPPFAWSLDRATNFSQCFVLSCRRWSRPSPFGDDEGDCPRQPFRRYYHNHRLNHAIAYCRYKSSGEIEYLFVGSFFRRQGHATLMLETVEAHLEIVLRFNPPISPLGQHVVGWHCHVGRAVAASLAVR